MSTKDTEEKKLNLIIFCDGGCKPNPGFGGYGYHGYLWKEKESKQSNGHPTHVLTNQGYVLKSDYKDIEKGKFQSIFEVEAVKYIDGARTDGPNSSNNLTELKAIVRSLEKALELDVGRVDVFSDSQYALSRFDKLDLMQRNNWKIDGEYVKNHDVLISLLEARNKLNEKGVSIHLHKVQGHSGDPGNDSADTLASIAVSMTINGLDRTEEDLTDAKGYWKVDIDRHPFLYSACTYFNTDPVTNKEGVYFLGAHGKKSELLGTKSTEGSYAIVQIDDKVELLETIRRTATSKALERGDYPIMLASLDRLFNAKSFKLVSEYQDLVLLQKPNNNSLYLLSTRSDALHVESLEPPRLAWRAFEAIDELYAIYEDAVKGTDKVTVTDITDLFYEDVITKKNETTKKLRDSFVVGFRSLEVKTPCIYKDKKYEPVIKIILGVDMPARNPLKRLEGMNPSISIVTWPESQQAFRYAIIINADGCRGIWAGWYSNYIYVQK